MHFTQSLHRSAQIGRNKTATVFGERTRTWAETIDRVARMAHALIGLGLQRGDRVAVIALNSDRYLELYFAVAWAGGVIVPGNIRWSVAEHSYGLRDAEASFLFVDDAFAALAGPLTADDRMPVIFMGEGQAPDGSLHYEDLIAAHDPIEDRCGRDDELCGIFYTGGTTGHPKGVMLSHRSLCQNAFYTNSALDFGSSPRVLHAAPLFHLAALSVLTAAMAIGAGNIIVPMFEPKAVVQAITANRATSSLFVPTMLNILVEHLAQHPTDVSCMRQVLYGASPISEALLHRAMALLPNVAFAQGYGQTELGAGASILMPEFHLPDGDRPAMLRSAGRAYPGVDLRIIDEEMREKPRGEVGEVAVRHDGIMLGYWKLPEVTAATIVDGWVRTGDAAYMDDDGFVFIVDRMKDMIISGGENVFSAEVENAIAKHAAVLECAVIGVPDDRWGERVHALLRLRDGQTVTEAEMISHCKALIANYKCPRSVEVRAEAFPLSAAGKILKRELRAPYWEGQTRGV